MFSYLLSITLVWVVLALYYRLFLVKETFFNQNRAYLLGALVGGMSLPWALSFWPVATPPLLRWQVTLPLTTVVENAAQWATMQGIRQEQVTWWWALYALGVVLQSVRLAGGLHRLWGWIVQSERVRDAAGFVYCYSTAVQTPMSFFRWILLPADTAEAQGDWESMLRHEEAHVRHRHSMDVVLIELLAVLFWFHPLIYWYRRALRQVHEYTADAAAAAYSSRKQYGRLLIAQAHSGYAPAVVHHFFQSPLKQRIMMLTRKRSGAANVWKYAFLLPVLGLLGWGCQQLKEQEEHTAYAPIATQALYQLTEVSGLPEFPGGEKGLMNYLIQNIHYPEKSRSAKVEGKVAVRFVIDKGGNVKDLEILKAPDAYTAEEARRVVSAMPKWKAATQTGQPVAVQFTLPISFKLE